MTGSFIENSRTFFRSTVAKLEERVRTLCADYLDAFVGSATRRPVIQ